MKIIIFGATSKIVFETCRLLAADGHSLYLVGRDSVKLSACAQDLRSRSLRPELIYTETADLSVDMDWSQILLRAKAQMSGLDGLFMGQGILGDQETAMLSQSERRDIWMLNGVVSAQILIESTKVIAQQGEQDAVVAVISSVSGDRARAKNFIYGASKSFISFVLAGLRADFAKSKIRFIDIRPGFISTPMTAHLKKGVLFTEASDIAPRVKFLLEEGRSGTAYLPGYWKVIMCIIRLLPFGIFKKLPF